MSILFSKVPEYLCDSELYVSLRKESDDDFEIDVNGEIPPSTEDVNNINDYILMFSVYDRWVKYPSESYFKFEEQNKIDIIKFLSLKSDSHINAKMMLERIIEPIISLNCSVGLNDYNDIKLLFTLKNRDNETNFKVTIYEKLKDKINFLEIIESIKNEDVKRICVLEEDFFICSEKTHLLLISELTGNNIKIHYTKYNRKILISCFNKIINNIENLNIPKNPEHLENIFTGQININNLHVLYNYFPEDTEFVDKVIEFINNNHIDGYMDFLSYKDDNGRVFNTRELGILMNIESIIN